MDYGKLYLIPSPLGDNDPAEVIPAPTLALLHDIKTYVVEDARTVRRYLSRAGLKGHIDELRMVELSEHVQKIHELEIEPEDDSLDINVTLDLRLGDRSALSIARYLQRKVRMGLSYFTGMDVKKVNINIKEVFI